MVESQSMLCSSKKSHSSRSVCAICHEEKPLYASRLTGLPAWVFHSCLPPSRTNLQACPMR